MPKAGKLTFQYLLPLLVVGSSVESLILNKAALLPGNELQANFQCLLGLFYRSQWPFKVYGYTVFDQALVVIAYRSLLRGMDARAVFYRRQSSKSSS
jgi:hypothetical protein